MLPRTNGRSVQKHSFSWDALVTIREELKACKWPYHSKKRSTAFVRLIDLLYERILSEFRNSWSWSLKLSEAATSKQFPESALVAFRNAHITHRHFSFNTEISPKARSQQKLFYLPVPSRRPSDLSSNLNSSLWANSAFVNNERRYNHWIDEQKYCTNGFGRAFPMISFRYSVSTGGGFRENPGPWFIFAWTNGSWGCRCGLGIGGGPGVGGPRGISLICMCGILMCARYHAPVEIRWIVES
jgi:hypothetical protein